MIIIILNEVKLCFYILHFINNIYYIYKYIIKYLINYRLSNNFEDNKNKLIIIIPYRDRKACLEILIPKMEEYLKF